MTERRRKYPQVQPYGSHSKRIRRSRRLGPVVMSFPCLAALCGALGARLGKRHEDFLLLSAAALADVNWPSH